MQTTLLEALADQFERHADREGEVLTEYRDLAKSLGDSTAGVLVHQILTDEEVHHLLLRTMATWLRGERAGAEALSVPAAANRVELLQRTRVLAIHERETIEACRDLQSLLAGEHAALLGALLEVLVLDSQKHEKLPRAVERLLATA